MSKIQMTTPLVEMDGDEMTRILWKMIKDELLLPFIDLKTEYYDLGLEHRNETNDQVTFDSAEATKKYGVAVKCATITPNAARMDEYDLKEMWKSPNGTIRAILDGTVFRAPITVKGIEPTVSKWKKPITIARHAYGDVYKGVEIKVPGAGKAELVFTGEDGTEIRETIHDFDGPGVIQGMHNIDASIASFARSCFTYALDTKQDLWFATKDTISKKYDHPFKDIFQEIYDRDYKEAFKKDGIENFYTLIDDAVARVMKTEGGFIWACKNYDGDVMSDMQGRRGMIMGMSSEKGYEKLAAKVPLKEMSNYSTALSSLTGGRASFIMKFASYELVPTDVQNKLMKEFEEQEKEEV